MSLLIVHTSRIHSRYPCPPDFQYLNLLHRRSMPEALCQRAEERVWYWHELSIKNNLPSVQHCHGHNLKSHLFSTPSHPSQQPPSLLPTPTNSLLMQLMKSRLFNFLMSLIFHLPLCNTSVNSCQERRLKTRSCLTWQRINYAFFFNRKPIYYILGQSVKKKIRNY